MSPRLEGRLNAARRRGFIGRDAERDMFRAALTAAELPFYVLHMYGPNGVGKRTLLREFASIPTDEGAFVITVDGRNVEPLPESSLAALRPALARLPGDQRQAVEPAYCCDLTYPETAERTGVPLGTVKRRIRLAMARLRAALAAPAMAAPLAPRSTTTPPCAAFRPRPA